MPIAGVFVLIPPTIEAKKSKITIFLQGRSVLIILTPVLIT